MAHPVRILIGDDSCIYRDGWRQLLGTVPAWELVGDTGDLAAVMPLVSQLRPTVVLLDLKWGIDRSAGLQLVTTLKSGVSPARVVAISAHEDLLARALKCGADAAISKDLGRTEIVEAIERVLVTAPLPGSDPTPEVVDLSVDPRLSEAIRGFLDYEAWMDVSLLSPGALSFLTSANVKIEAIECARPRNVVAATSGFELFRIGARGERYLSLLRMAKASGVSPSLFSATSLVVGFEAADQLRGAGRRLGLPVDGLEFSVNLDAEALASGLVAPILRRYRDLLGLVALEVHEAVRGRFAVVALEELLETFDAVVVLDDVNRLESRVRRRLHSRAIGSKVDFRSFQSMTKDLWRSGDAIVAELVSLAWDKPLTVEGVAEKAYAEFLRERWPVKAPELKVQGHAIHPRAPWPSVLEPLVAYGHPSAYRLTTHGRRTWA